MAWDYCALLESALAASVNVEDITDAWNEHDDNLEANGTNNNEAEHNIVEYVLEDVEFIIDSSGVELVEDLDEDEEVVNSGISVSESEFSKSFFSSIIISSLFLKRLWNKSHDITKFSEHHQQDEEGFINADNDDVSKHTWSDKRSRSVDWWAVEDRLVRAFGGESQRTKRVHDQVDIQKLDRSEWRLLDDSGTQESNEQSEG